MLSSKLILAVDIDDVLAATTLGIIAHASEVLKQTMRLGDIKSVDYWLEYGIADIEAIALVQGYNDLGFPGLEPVDGAREYLSKLSLKFDIHAITARDIRVSKATHDWLAANFAGLIKQVHFVGNKYVSDKTVSKAQICHDIGAQVAIDDDSEHIIDYVKSGVKAIVFGDYPWASYESMPDDATRCKDWTEVYERLNG